MPIDVPYYGIATPHPYPPHYNKAGTSHPWPSNLSDTFSKVFKYFCHHLASYSQRQKIETTEKY